jgi:hypothetical protein
MITMNKMGGRTIELYIPFEYQGRKIESITLAPYCLDHTLLWNEAKWTGMMGLLCSLSGQDEHVIRQLRQVDAERVSEAFLAMIAPEVRNDIATGHIPQARPTEEFTEQLAADIVARQQRTDGQQIPVGPGVPLPETGFDIGDEQP